MSFFKYLKENLKLIIFYILLTSFITSVIFFDRKERLLGSDTFYIIFVSIIMFALYILYDYFTKYFHMKKLLKVSSSKDDAPILPKPMDSKDEAYSTIIRNLYDYYSESINNAEKNSSENKDFINSWIHEIKTPITTSKLLIENYKNEPSKSVFDSIEEEIDNIDEYVEKVLYYSRSSDFSKDYVISEENILKIVKESIKKHSILFIEKHIKLILEVSDSETIDTDRKWLLFIINQLLSNSLKYTQQNGSIKFSFYKNDKEKILIIEDTGIGIKSEDLKRIFDKSYTGFNGRMKGNHATGLGLYLAQKLSKKLGHYITIESEFKKGTKAEIHFPKWDDYFDVTKM